MLNSATQLCSVALLLLTQTILAQDSYYVSQIAGSDTHGGTAPSTPKQTMGAATALLQPGDTLFVMGEWTNASFNENYSFSALTDAHLWHSENTIRIANLHGTAAGGYITLKAYDATTKLRGDGANIFRIQNCSYLRIEGFEIEGQVNSIPLTTANAMQFAYVNASTHTVHAGGIVPNQLTAGQIRHRLNDDGCIAQYDPADPTYLEQYTGCLNIKNDNTIRPSYVDTRGLYLSGVAYVEVLDNEIHHLPGGGLRVSEAHAVNIIGNDIHNNSRKSYSGTHGLVVTKALSSPPSFSPAPPASVPTLNDTYLIRIERNRVHFNYNEQYSWAPSKTIVTPHLDEGKGISLQRNDHANSGDWLTGRILVANNLAYYNGFSGIHSNDGERIDFVNNTAFLNSYTRSFWEPCEAGLPNGTSNNGGNIGISVQGGGDNGIYNNISIIDPDLNKSAIATNLNNTSGNPTNITVENNLIYGIFEDGALCPLTNNDPTTCIKSDADIDAVVVNEMEMDPQFVNAGNVSIHNDCHPSGLVFDFSLLAGSPAIGAANAARAPAVDFFGNPRSDGAPDVGAVEFSAVLPVVWLDFTARLVKPSKTVELRWETALEWNNAGFDVERSTDGRTFQTIGWVPGQNEASHYEFLDRELPAAATLLYYRLRQVDEDGKQSYSEVRSVRIESSTDYALFPNPTTDAVTLTTAQPTDTDLTARVVDVLGRTVRTQTLAAGTTWTLDLRDLAPGTYLVEVTDGATTWTERLVLR